MLDGLFLSRTQVKYDAMDILQSLADYNQFVEQYLPHQHDPNGRACYAQTIPINGIEVGIYGFNSAWSSGGAEDDRHLWLAAQWQFNQAKAALADSTVRIGLIHHPVDWLTDVERKVAKVRFEQAFDFLYPKSLEMQLGGKGAKPHELSLLSDWGSRLRPTTLQFQG